MKDAIPFFYYDILTKMIPGSLLLAYFGVICRRASTSWLGLFSGAQGGWRTVVEPLVLAGAVYVLGSLIDAVFRLLKLADFFSAGAWKREREKALQQGYLTLPRELNASKFHHAAWQWLALRIAPVNSPAFTLAHRFQAEGRLLLFSAPWVSLLVAHQLRSQLSPCTCLVVGLVIFLSFTACGWNCETRRWVQVLAAINYCRDKWPETWHSNLPST